VSYAVRVLGTVRDTFCPFALLQIICMLHHLIFISKKLQKIIPCENLYLYDNLYEILVVILTVCYVVIYFN
jgi:hypothetical protein